MAKVNGMNSLLHTICRNDRRVKLMRNNNITERMLSPNDRGGGGGG